jgi:hypothetical protein
MSAASIRPNAFQPDTTKATDVRIAEALEFIAARLGMIEYDTTLMRTQLMQIPHLLGAALAQGPGRPGVP